MAPQRIHCYSDRPHGTVKLFARLSSAMECIAASLLQLDGNLGSWHEKKPKRCQIGLGGMWPCRVRKLEPSLTPLQHVALGWLSSLLGNVNLLVMRSKVCCNEVSVLVNWRLMRQSERKKHAAWIVKWRSLGELFSGCSNTHAHINVHIYIHTYEATFVRPECAFLSLFLKLINVKKTESLTHAL